MLLVGKTLPLDDELNHPPDLYQLGFHPLSPQPAQKVSN